MPPLPKPEALRQRTNKASTRKTLSSEIGPRDLAEKPRLPNCPNEGGWHSMAVRWWNDVWLSPMSAEFVRGDDPALFRLVVLVDLFWKNPQNVSLSAEIRLCEREFGLTPLSRRRLEWSVVQAEDSKDRHEQRRVARARVVDVDPRNVLAGE